jgi:ATP-binding cassette subfamily B protein
MSLLRRLYNLLAPFRAQIHLVFWLTLVFEIVKLANPYLFKEIIDTILEFSPTAVPRLVALIAIMLVVDILASLFYRSIDVKRFTFLLGVLRYLPELAQQKLIALSLEYHQRENTGNKISKIIRGIDKIDQLLGSVLWDFLPTLFQLITTIVFFAILDWQLALVFCVVVPPYLWLTLRMNMTARPWRQHEREIDEEVTGRLGQSIMNIRTVQSYAQEAREVADSGTLLDELHQVRWNIWKTILNYNVSRNTMIDTGRVLTLAFGIFQTYTGVITPGSLVLFLTLSEKAYLSLYRFSRMYDRVLDSAEAIVRLDTLISEEPDIKSPEDPVAKRVVGNIQFSEVSFSYTDDIAALRDVTFGIEAGQTVAIVGPSGSGKSTLVNLLYRHYDVTAGSIAIDGVDLRKLDLYQYRHQLGIVTQDIDIFNDTVANNIAYAMPGASKADIVAAAQAANAAEFIEKLPQGYDTIVGERGVKLSGGQRQRIGIARALLPKPKVLVFDEATSHLDSISESLIQEALQRLHGTITLIIIAHRLSTVRFADKILVFTDGELVEQGTHRELRDTGGLYDRLHQLQVSGDLA